MRKGLVWLLIAVVLAVGAAGGVYWFNNNFVLASRTVRGGYGEAALRDPFLAAERLIRRLGGQSGSISGTGLWRKLPPPDGVLVIDRFGNVLDPRRQQAFRNWVTAGGRLVVVANSSLLVRRGVRPKGFLAALGVRLKLARYDSKHKPPETVAMHFADYPQAVHVHLSPFRYLEDRSGKATAAVRWEKGYGLLQYRLGKGVVTVLSDIGFITNRQIGRHDHALALALLLDLPRHPHVWFVRDVKMPSLATLIWQRAPAAVVAAAVLIFLWLWSLGGRLGPLLPSAQRPRRDLGEHLEAGANYLWRLDKAQRLFSAHQRRLEQQWLHKHYALRAMTREQRCAWIADRTGLAPGVVDGALYGEYRGEREFVELTRHLQVLEMAL